MKSTPPCDVAVIGAGPAGLAAAQRLSSKGIRVAVFEQASTPGGRAGCDAIGEFRFDRGAEFVTSFYPRTLKLIREQGLRSQLVRVRLEGDVLHNRQRSPLPVNPALLCSTPLLSWSSRLRLAALVPRLLWWRFRFRWADLVQGAPWDDCSAVEMFQRLIGDDFVENLLGPILESFILSPAHQTSCVMAMVQMQEALGARFYCLQGGMATLWETVALKLDVHYQRDVVLIRPAQGRVQLTFRDGSEVSVSAVILAVPAPSAVSLLPREHPERHTAELARYASVVKLHSCLPESLSGLRPVCTSGLGGKKLAGIGCLESKATHQVPEGKGSLHIWSGPELGLELLEAADDVVRIRLEQEAEKMLGLSLPRSERHSLVRLREGLPIFYPGWLRHLYHRETHLKPASITLAGDYLASPSMEGAVSTGQRAADRVYNWLDQNDGWKMD